jgi:cardiolipin synthase
MDNFPTFIVTLLAIILDIAIRIFLIFYIPRGRKPTAATAWLLAIFLIPGVLVLLLFGIIGTTRPSRTRRRRQAIINAKVLASQQSDIQESFDDAFDPFIYLSRNLSKFPAVWGNRSTLHDDYVETIDRITKDVSRAKHYVYVESYILSLDAVTEKLFVAMEKAVERGVAVYVLFDSFGSRSFKNARAMKKRMSCAGIRWKPMLPISLIPGKYSRPDLRNHRKLIAIDNSVSYIGSLNLIEPRYERKDDIIYEELVLRAEGPIAAHTAAIIAGDWYSETAEILDHFQETPQQTDQTGQLMQIIPSGPAYKNENNLKLFLSLIYSAKKKIVITNPYLVPGEPLLMALITAAQRGVDVTILNSEAVDQLMVGHAQRSYYMQILSAGIHLHLRKAPTLLHSKHITIDDNIAIIGSSNMDVRSFELNYECSLAIYDKAVVKKLQKIQARNISESYLLTKTIWKKRGLWSLFLDSVARLTSALQ